jgi:hypothetical protein
MARRQWWFIWGGWGDATNSFSQSKSNSDQWRDIPNGYGDDCWSVVMAEIDILTTTITAAQSLSPQIDIGTKSLVGLVIPANWVAAAGGISLQVSPDGGATWYELTTVAGPYAIAFTAAGAACIAIDPTTLRGLVSFKIRSGTAGAPVPQTNTVTLQLLTRLAF